MTMQSSLRNLMLATMLATATGAATAGGSGGGDIESQVSGLWFYTGLTTSGGDEMPLTGVFLFKDDVFVQQAVFDGEPFESQGAMAHAGPYEVRDDHVHLIAEQTISTSGGEAPELSFRSDTEHDVTVARDGDELRLVFSMGTGTIQDFRYVGPGEGELYDLGDGQFALVDGHFVLVQGDENGVVTGYGTYERDGDSLTLDVIRWTEAGAGKVKNLRDVELAATFDGESLKLADGRRFTVAD